MARTPSLDTGDAVEFSSTIQFTPSPGMTIWLKAGATTSVRPGETGSRTFKRLSEFVEAQLEAKTEEYTK